MVVHGDRAYVTNSDGKTVTVIDTTTNRVLGSFTTDNSSGFGVRAATVGSDGRLYITDEAENQLYTTSFGTSV